MLQTQPQTQKVRTKVLVMMTDFGMIPKVGKVLASAGFKPQTDFLILSNDVATETQIVPGEKQLLVVDRLYGSPDVATRFAQRMKGRNPNLRVGSFAINPKTGVPYDYSITRSDKNDFKGLVAVMERFLAAPN